MQATPEFIEAVSARVHRNWMDMKRSAGIDSCKSPNTGEELMVDYRFLSGYSKDLAKSKVSAVLHAAEEVREQEETIGVTAG